MEAALVPTDWAKVVDPVTQDDQRFASDSKLYVQFYSRPILQLGESEAADRPIFKDIDHVRIIVPGDKLSIIDRIASSDDQRRFPEHYAKYKAGQGQEVVGTRLEVIPWMTRAKVEEYKFFSIHTVEQLAEASDSVGQKFQGFHSDRDRARKWLEASSGTNARVTELENQLAALQAQVAAAAQAKAAAKDAEDQVQKAIKKG